MAPVCAHANRSPIPGSKGYTAGVGRWRDKRCVNGHGRDDLSIGLDIWHRRASSRDVFRAVTKILSAQYLSSYVLRGYPCAALRSYQGAAARRHYSTALGGHLDALSRDHLA